MHKNFKIQRSFISNIKSTSSKLIGQTTLHTLSSSRNALYYSFDLESSQTLLYALRKLHFQCKILDIQQKLDKLWFSIKETFSYSQLENNYLIRFGREREITNKKSEPSKMFSESLAKPKFSYIDGLDNLHNRLDKNKDKEDKEDRKLAWPPKLPLIKNSDIMARVFTHRSMTKFKTIPSKADWLNSHNQRLEFLGDTVLNYTVTMILYKKFPNMDEGDLTKMRIELINNKRLKEWSFLYNFQNNLREVLVFSPKDNISQAEFQLRKQKIYADVFEA